MSEETIFTEADIAFGYDTPVLGPEYHAARSFMDRFMAGWEDEHLKPLADAIAKEVTEKIREKVWDDFRDYLMMDTEANAAGAIRGMVNDTVKAILSGEKWAMDRYPLAKSYHGETVRKAIAAHIPDQIAAARIADLEKELASAKQSIEWLRQ